MSKAFRNQQFHKRSQVIRQERPEVWRKGFDKATSNDVLSVPAGWARKSEQGTSTFRGVIRNGRSAVRMHSPDGDVVWSRIIDETGIGNPPTSYQNAHDYGLYHYGVAENTYLNGGSGGNGLVTGHIYRIELELEIISGGFRFQRVSDGVTTSVDWTTSGWKVHTFECGNDNNFTFIRPSICDVYIFEVNLYYEGTTL